MILFTAAEEDSSKPTQLFEEADLDFLHLPLERYVEIDDEQQIEQEFGQIDEYENIIHGRKRSAIFFMDQVEKRDMLEPVQNRLNLALHQETADYLEDHGVPAVLPGEETRGIKLVEFMLRLQRYGKTLYPCGTHESEDIPGFLKELDIEVTELPLFELEGPGDAKLDEFQQKVANKSLDTVIFYNRRSVNRIRAAFPELDYEQVTVVAADSAITDKLADNKIKADITASGSWDSIVEKLQEKE